MWKKLLAAVLCCCVVLAAMTGCAAAPQPLPEDVPSDGEEASLPEESQPPEESREPSSREQAEQERPDRAEEERPTQPARNSLPKENAPSAGAEQSAAGQSAAGQPAAGQPAAGQGQTTAAVPSQPTVATPEESESEAEAEELPASTAQTGGSGGKAVNVNDYSESYRGSVYYRQLKAVSLTGNYRADILAVARSQLGYMESDSSTKLDGSKAGNGNYTEYGRFCGTNGTAWCSEFASWCARQAGIPTSVLGTSASARAERFGGAYHPWSDTVYAGGRFQPRPGDLVFFAWSEASRTAAAKDHTGIFVSADWTADSLMIYTLDGNSGDMVRNNLRIVTNQKTGRIAAGWIAGFIAPDYGDGDGMVQGKVTPPEPAKPSGTAPAETQKPSGSAPAGEPAKETPAPPETPAAPEQKPTETPEQKPSEPPAGEEQDPTGEGEEDDQPEQPSSGESGEERPGEDAEENTEE